MDEDVTCTHVHAHTYTYCVEYYSAIKRTRLMPFAATWMDLDIVILNEFKSDTEIQIS